VHIGVVARHEIEYPGSKIVCAKKRDESLVFLFGRAHGVVDIRKFHGLSFKLLSVILEPASDSG
jgi:hypothetical protein